MIVFKMLGKNVIFYCSGNKKELKTDIFLIQILRKRLNISTNMNSNKKNKKSVRNKRPSDH